MTIYRIQQSLASVLLVSLTLLLAGCGSNGSSGPSNQATPGTYVGDTQPLGNGTVRSYATIDANGRPQSIGVVLTEAALTGLPDTTSPSVRLSFPSQAGVSVLNHVEVTYQPTGHAPPGIYDIPQFDVSFFRVSPEFRQQIQTIGQDNFNRVYKVARSQETPPTYFLEPGSAVPTFGAQYVYFQSPELVNRGFTVTTNYLYYDGGMIGIQPLVSTTYLNQRGTRVDDVQTPLEYPINGFWPSKTAVRYDAAAKEYTIAMEGFVYRQK